MAIPESQLNTWSHQGSITQSSITYNSIKTTLDATDTPYAVKTYKVFLQGSYGNDTNIYSESDVDIVIRLDDCFQHDLSQLPVEQQETFKTSHSDATYTHQNFKSDVLAVLSSKYGSAVDLGEKAIAMRRQGIAGSPTSSLRFSIAVTSSFSQARINCTMRAFAFTQTPEPRLPTTRNSILKT